MLGLGRAAGSVVPAQPAADRCPGVLDLHEAGDGLLARVRLPGGRISATQLDAVAAVAAMGNGIVEITSRANLQLRGLTPTSGDAAAERFTSAGLLPSIAHERVRNIQASPVAGRHPDSLTAVDDLVGELDRELCSDPALAALSGRFLFAVDDGSGIGIDPAADVVLCAVGRDAFHLYLAGLATTLTAQRDGAAAVAVSAARAFAENAACRGAWRIVDAPEGAARVASALGAELRPDVGLATRTPELGVLAQPDGRSAITALAPLGRLDPGALPGPLRLSGVRTVTVVDVANSNVDRMVAAIDAAGLVLSATSGWWGLSACSGRGACARARADVRAAAMRRARIRGAGAPVEHWAGCDRGCGRPPAVAVTVTATESGIVVDEPGGRTTLPDLAAAEARLAGAAP